MDLALTDVWLSFAVVAPFRAPRHAGSMLRGVFGWALRDAACTSVAADDCGEGCGRARPCLWAELFHRAPGALPDHPVFRGVNDPPAPYVPLVPPPGEQELAPGDEVGFGLRFFGAFPPERLGTLAQAAEAFCRYPLGPDAGRVEPLRLSLLGSRERALHIGYGVGDETSATLVFETPVRLKREGPAALRPDFAALFDVASRRLGCLAQLYGHYDDGDDARFAALRGLAARIAMRPEGGPLRHERWQRHSGRRGEVGGSGDGGRRPAAQPLEGLLGAVRIEGPIAPFMPTLAAITEVHVGRDTSFGLGRVRLGP